MLNLIEHDIRARVTSSHCPEQRFVTLLKLDNASIKVPNYCLDQFELSNMPDVTINEKSVTEHNV